MRHIISTLDTWQEIGARFCLCVLGSKFGCQGPDLILSLVEIATFNNLLLFQIMYYLNGNHNITLLPTFRKSLRFPKLLPLGNPYLIIFTTLMKSPPFPKSLPLGNPYLIIFTTLMKSLPFPKSLPLSNPYLIVFTTLIKSLPFPKGSDFRKGSDFYKSSEYYEVGIA